MDQPATEVLMTATETGLDYKLKPDLVERTPAGDIVNPAQRNRRYVGKAAAVFIEQPLGNGSLEFAPFRQAAMNRVFLWPSIDVFDRIDVLSVDGVITSTSSSTMLTFAPRFHKEKSQPPEIGLAEMPEADQPFLIGIEPIRRERR
jgi:hypothetical protein